MSCNGCRVLRKGCSDSCILRPCLQWIDGAEAQGHATVFVAKFFGRAGLMNFITAIPENQRPALFQSLLFEACGRTVNPVLGAVGLLWSGNWQLCQAAVETVLKGGSLQPLIAAVRSLSPPADQLSSLQQVMNSSPASYNFHSKSPDSVLMEAIKSQQQQQGDEEFIAGFKAAAAGGGGGGSLQIQQRIRAAAKSINPPEEHPSTTSVKRESPSSAIVAPIPRRIRPRYDHFAAFADDHHQSRAPVVDLDLTLGFHSSSKDELNQQSSGKSRVHSPCESITSEGSVTSVDTADHLKISLRNHLQQQQQQHQLI